MTELCSPPPDVVYASPYRRAVQTVTPSAAELGLPVLTRTDLREWDSGLAPTPDYARHYAASWADPKHCGPGGESLGELTARASAALVDLVARHPEARIVVGTHGTFLARALVGPGVAVDWPFSRDMASPAVFRVRGIGTPDVRVSGPGLSAARPGNGSDGARRQCRRADQGAGAAGPTAAGPVRPGRASWVRAVAVRRRPSPARSTGQWPGELRASRLRPRRRGG
ncbi:hypothetical protein FHR81_000859 [Actinoalloteichus hoggarensis]|uniref:histidine phosphatase family protein n=1 Tax=Actinoalloteichus hoggarensis TaxID=1470176 RepID=UPI0016136BAD|nr:histidine phosphatase family protein [Actinoalloteichus hoggarensis]MBB5919830.1 hypothetical protein [Actinoalloteichus hoggarensis]